MRNSNTGAQDIPNNLLKYTFLAQEKKAKQDEFCRSQF